ncbi:uncharacterized protein LOC130959218 isoform X3 [Arachis stenosperma]|uniref:uncharacterized protein LOC130959218 isoform X3 n=1 Tax=Arachis stenosperma TaxID=217475 RepID=UPI0025ABF1F0|nr:uncharacterized protein LOC130959218 isoform X3 [Arachis stenosperma]XP_057741263.1 uncharacterized protein LOC130959218 isoform X3 [Arachis stenosperma]
MLMTYELLTNPLWKRDYDLFGIDDQLLYSSGSKRCAQFSESWNKIASLLHPFANTGMVELGEVQLAVYLADKRSTEKPYFINGIPYLLAIPPGCCDVKCFSRFDGELIVDKVTNWFATTVLALPQINYYSKESLVPKLFGKSTHHKVKVIFFTKSGERAAPFIRQAAKDYWDYASFAFILWREEESSYWMGA